MNDKDREALHTWIDNDALSPDETALFKGMSDQERVIFAIERTWQAACEYKQKEIDDILGQLKSCIFVYEEKVNRLIAENEKLRDNILLLQEKTLVLGELEAENKKLREALSLVEMANCYTDYEDAVDIAREALKENSK